MQQKAVGPVVSQLSAESLETGLINIQAALPIIATHNIAIIPCECEFFPITTSSDNCIQNQLYAHEELGMWKFNKINN